MYFFFNLPFSRDFSGPPCGFALQILVFARRIIGQFVNRSVTDICILILYYYCIHFTYRICHLYRFACSIIHDGVANILLGESGLRVSVFICERS